ncbi:ABC transporter ATP-binding protein [Rhodococcus sp. NPDC058521]|uniref:ABC transporter ATP-binding protein n=1 Tax=Rhodococcus sp. NPDC058521 TaxID=3346536 RepID=UPI003650F236
MIGKLLALSDPAGRRQLRMLLVCIVVGAILQGAAFVALVPFLTDLFDGDNNVDMTWLIVLVVLGVLYAVAFWAGSRLGQTAANQVVEVLLNRLGDRLVELPLGWFAADRSGDAADIATRGIVFASCAPYAILRPILTGLITPATVLVGTIFIDWRIAITMAAAVPVIWIVYLWLGRRIALADKENVAAVGVAASRIIEFSRVQPALRAAGENSIARNLVDQALRGQHAANRRANIAGGAAIGLFGGVVQLAVVAVIVVGTFLALDNSLAVPSLVALLVLAVRFAEPIIHSGALGGGISIATNTLDRIQELVDEPTLTEPAAPVAPADWSIRFDHVTFGYGGDAVLRDLTFEAPTGAMTAIVGPSGSGKTTITRLIARFYDPEQGTVTIGGASLPQLGSEQITRAVAPVFQDVYLFDGTVLENVWLGNPEASRDEAIGAGERARVDEIVQRLPGGWDARVGEGGTSLSGGERQRVSIARALLKDAPIVVLDEATAALDIGNEQAIAQAFDVIRRDRTLVVIAHRLSTIASADKIIMLDPHGSIAEQGTHDQLLASGGDYARYWSERVDATGWHLAHASSIP